MRQANVLKHVKVYHQPGRYGGWPANHGIYAWGDEILVGFQTGFYKEQRGHAIDWGRPIRKVFGRSLDGGESWQLEDTLPDALDNPVHTLPAESALILPHANALPCPGDIDFTQPDFVMTFSHSTWHAGTSRFWASYDRGHTWAGPYRLPDMDTPGVAARSDYLVNGPRDCTLFLTAAKGDGREGRPFCARTRDGGKSWTLVAWIGPEPEGYAIMPASVRLSGGGLPGGGLPDGEILVLLREQNGEKRSAISAYLSQDDGVTWGKLADPVPDLKGPSNPPSLIRLRDGRLCLTYGVRHAPYRICARLSADQGRTWGDEIALRDNGADWDLGYVRSILRADGCVVTVYYFHDAGTGPERYIGATLWQAIE